MNDTSQEMHPVETVYVDLKQTEGYRDFIQVVKTPDGDGIRIGVGGRVVTKPIRQWLELAWPASAGS